MEVEHGDRRKILTNTIPCCVRGYHVYQRIWSPRIGEKATTVREPDNECDRYAVAVLEQETV